MQKVIGEGWTKLNRHIPSLWTVMINYFNFRRDSDNGIISRKELIWHLRTHGYKRETTIDCYRNYLHKAGYLNTVARGKYVMRRKIPSNLPIELCKEQAYGSITKKVQKEYDKQYKPFKRNDFIKKDEMTI